MLFKAPGGMSPNDFLTLVNTGLVRYIHYDDATYDYHCNAVPGTAAATSEWIIKRVNKSTGEIDFAGGTIQPSSPATSLLVVAALSYS